MRMFRIVAAALALSLVPLSLSAQDLIGLNGINPILMGPDQVKLQVSWNWPPWGANMRVEYGPTASYGKATDWVGRSGYPFSGTSELMLSGVSDGPTHYRVVIQPSGGPRGQDGFTMDYTCHPAGSDFCKDTQTFRSKFETVCTHPKLPQTVNSVRDDRSCPWPEMTH